MQSFEFQTTNRIFNEIGGLSRTAEICGELEISNLLIVTDEGVFNHGLLEDIKSILKQNKIAFEIFKDVEADPSDQTAINAANFGKEHKANGVLGIGGGSAMDTAKVVSILLLNKGANTQVHLEDLSPLYGVNQITKPRSPLILVPTTAGTGSEVTPISILTTGETTKSGIVSSVLLPDIAILDASLTLGLPSHITASTGIDAMVHAIEAYTSKVKKNPYSDMLAKHALLILSNNIETAVINGKNLTARQNMLFGACLAGQAFANSPVGGVHALAYPLGGHFHVSHGLSNSLVLPHVMRFNESHASRMYCDLAEVIMADNMVNCTVTNSTEILANYFLQLAVSFDLPIKLRQVGVDDNFLSVLAEDAMKQTRLLVNNPKEMTYEDALRIYQKAY